LNLDSTSWYAALVRVVIVTGGAGGLGRAMVERFLADGAHVAIADLDGAAAVAAAAEHERALPVQVDVADAASAERIAAAVLAAWGRVDVLVNNAGIAGPTAPVSDYPVADWHRVVAVNLTGAFHCTRACLPHMLERGEGRIVNVASIAGKDPNAGMSAYSASKAGVVALTKSVAKETATSGVLVNCVVPGVIDAGLTAKTTDEERALFLAKVPMGRMGRPEELAEMVAWVASPACSFTTGATFDLSGGR
jgi:NAD(P)-dependent dehydrogenase (short-subunit alcohol dehydrogenase family)